VDDRRHWVGKPGQSSAAGAFSGQRTTPSPSPRVQLKSKTKSEEGLVGFHLNEPSDSNWPVDLYKNSELSSVRHRPDWSNFRYGRVGLGCTQTDQKVALRSDPDLPYVDSGRSADVGRRRPSHPPKVEVSYSIQSACARWIRQPPRPLTDRLQSIKWTSYLRVHEWLDD